MASPSKAKAQEAAADAAAAAISTAEIAACYVMAHSWGLQEREAQQAQEKAEAGEPVDEEAAAVAAKHAAGLLSQSSLIKLLASGGESGSILRLQTLSALTLCEAVRAQWTGEEAEVVEATASDWRRSLHTLTPAHDSTSIAVDGIPDLVGGALDAAFQLDGEEAGAADDVTGSSGAGTGGDGDGGGESKSAGAPRSPRRHKQQPRSQKQRAADRKRKEGGTVAGLVSQLAMHTMELVAAGTAQNALLAGRRANQLTKADVTACVACIASIVDPGSKGHESESAADKPASKMEANADTGGGDALALMAHEAKAAVEAAGVEVRGEADKDADDDDYGDDDGFDSPAKTSGSGSAVSGAGFAPTTEPEQAGSSSSGTNGLLSLGAAMVEAAESATAVERRNELREREDRAHEREGRLQVERSVTRREQRLEAAADEAAAAERAVRAEERREDARMKLLAGEFHPSEEAIQKEIARLRHEKEEKRKHARELRKRHAAAAEERGTKRDVASGDSKSESQRRRRRRQKKGDALDEAMEETAHNKGIGAKSERRGKHSKREDDTVAAAAAEKDEKEDKEKEEEEEKEGNKSESKDAEGDQGEAAIEPAAGSGEDGAELDGTHRKTGRRKGGKKRGMKSTERLERQQAVFALRAAAYQDAVSVPGATGPKADKRAARRLVPRIKHNHSASAAARAILHSQVPASFHTFHVPRAGKATGDDDEETKEEHEDADGENDAVMGDGSDAKAATGSSKNHDDHDASISKTDEKRRRRTKDGSSTARGRLRGAAATGKSKAKAAATRSRSPRARRPAGRKAASPRKGASSRKAASPRKRTGRQPSPTKRTHKQTGSEEGAGLTVGAGTAEIVSGADTEEAGSTMQRDDGAVASTPQARQRDPGSLSPGSHSPSGAGAAVSDGADASGGVESASPGHGLEEDPDKSGIVFTVTEDGQMPPLTLPQAPADQEKPDEAAAAMTAQWAAKGSPRYHASTAVAEPAARLKLAARTYNAPQPDRPNPLRAKHHGGGGGGGEGGRGGGKKTKKRRGGSPRKKHGKRDGDGAAVDSEDTAQSPPNHPSRPKRPQGHRGARGGAGPRGGRAAAVPVGPATSEDPGFDRKDPVAEEEEDDYEADMEAEDAAPPDAGTATEQTTNDAEGHEAADYEGEWD